MAINHLNEVKGTGIIGILNVIKQSYNDSLDQILEATSPEFKELYFGVGILKGSWYDMMLYNDLLKAVWIVYKSDEMIRNMSYKAVMADFTSIYKAFAKALGPDWFIRTINKGIRLYIKHGKATCLKPDIPKCVRVQFVDFRGYTRLLWQDNIGGYIACLEFATNKKVYHRIIEGAEDIEFALIDFYWK